MKSPKKVVKKSTSDDIRYLLQAEWRARAPAAMPMCRVSCRRQNRHGRQGRQRSLRQQPEFQRLSWRPFPINNPKYVVLTFCDEPLDGEQTQYPQPIRQPP